MIQENLEPLSTLQSFLPPGGLAATSLQHANSSVKLSLSAPHPESDLQHPSAAPSTTKELQKVLSGRSHSL